jgi:cellulose synthase/poly-beta-1,6-N-acetylglucosamine synthase-like glycosyltransferase
VINDALLISWSIAGAAAACITLPGSVELLTLSVAALLPGRRRAPTQLNTGPWRTAVVIPAHNEEAGIASCVESLLRAQAVDRPEDMYVNIYVISDNCTDNTAQIAEAAGAIVLQRTNPVERGKGYALHFAFTHLETIGYDCVLVVDADTEVAPNFLTTAAGAMRSGAQAVQARYLVRNLSESTRTRLMGLALRAFNVVRPLGREHLGLSAGIFGNGFGLRRDTLQAVPYLASSVVEDLEYHLALVRSGRRVTFLNETAVYGEMPVRGKGVVTQRSRWEGGRLRMLAEKSPTLLREVLRGRLTLLEPLLDLLLLPLAFHVTLLIVAISAPLPIVRDIGLAGAAIVLLHLVAAIVVGGGNWRDAVTLAVAPFYVLWKLTLIPSLLRNARSNQAWVRTTRTAESAQPTQADADAAEPGPKTTKSY